MLCACKVARKPDKRACTVREGKGEDLRGSLYSSTFHGLFTPHASLLHVGARLDIAKNITTSVSSIRQIQYPATPRTIRTTFSRVISTRNEFYNLKIRTGHVCPPLMTANILEMRPKSHMRSGKRVVWPGECMWSETDKTRGCTR